MRLIGKHASVSRRAVVTLCIGVGLTACETIGVKRVSDEPAWSATGYLRPDPTGDPEIIGFYFTEEECLDAAEAWKARQVVGNPIYAECLPVDRN
ncbi:MAG: hypothetical protein AAGJ73_12650 [Pseudomonadota bacterium]